MQNPIIYAHIVAMVLASWRVVELFTQDRITERLREKFPTFVWQCPRCMSVWAGAWCVLVFALGPLTHNVSVWLNWPFALSWLYVTHVDWVMSKRMAERGRRLVIEARDNQWKVSQNEFTAEEVRTMFMGLVSSSARPNGVPQQ